MSPCHLQIDGMEWEYTRSRRPRATSRQMGWNGNTPDQDVPVPPPDRWDGMGIHQIKTSPCHLQIDGMEWEYTRSRCSRVTSRQMGWNGNTPDQDVPVSPPDRWDGMGIHQIKTSPCHLQTNGMVERLNSTLKHLLRKQTQKETMEWDKCLPFILWAYNGSIQKSIGYSPYWTRELNHYFGPHKGLLAGACGKGLLAGACGKGLLAGACGEGKPGKDRLHHTLGQEPVCNHTLWFVQHFSV